MGSRKPKQVADDADDLEMPMPQTDLPTSFAFIDLDRSDDWVTAYREHGYCIIRGVFAEAELEPLRERFDAWYAEGIRHPSTYRHRNQVIWIDNDDSVGRFVRGMQWPSYADPVLAATRTDPRLLRILEPLIGRDLKQIINQLHWKTPQTGVTWGLHRDRRSRTPAAAFRELATSYVQTGLAIDRHWVDNGAMMVGRGSHRLAASGLFQGSSNYRDTMEAAYRANGFDTDSLVPVEMEAGDIALWGPDTVHGGGINSTADNFRRLYINGYATAANTDRGEWAWRDGQPITLDADQQALIQFEGVATQREPFYPDAGSAAAIVSD